MPDEGPGWDVVVQQNPKARKYERIGKVLYQGGVQIAHWQLTDDELKKYFPTEWKGRMAEKEKKRRAEEIRKQSEVR